MGVRQQLIQSATEIDKKKFASEDIMCICLAWNKFAPIRHSVFSRAMQSTVFEVLKDYEAEDVVQAILKYAAVLSEPKKYWWTSGGYILQTFLTKDNGSILTRFIDTPLSQFTRDEEIKNASELLPKI